MKARIWFVLLLLGHVCAQQQTDALMSKAVAAMEAGDVDAAVAGFKAVIEKAPDSGRAWHLLGYTLHGAGRLDDALKAHKKAAEFPESRAIATYNIACVYALRGNPDMAFAWLGKAVARGFTNHRHTESDEDLRSLRDDARFKEMTDLMQTHQRGKAVNVAIFVHEGVELLDFAGPGEAFSGARSPDGRRTYVYTVAQSTTPINSQGFLRVTPEFTFEDCPEPDVIVLPGGATGLALRTTDVVAWVKKTAPRTQVVMSVCTGAMILGKAGLLDGREATTHWGAIDRLERAYPKCKVRRDLRVVDNGRIVTTAGVSAGIDGALHVLTKLFGKDAAKRRARGMEYVWTPPTAVKPAPAATPKKAVAAGSGPYRCPPCSCSVCGDVFKLPGFCPECGMRLVKIAKK